MHCLLTICLLNVITTSAFALNSQLLGNFLANESKILDNNAKLALSEASNLFSTSLPCTAHLIYNTYQDKAGLFATNFDNRSVEEINANYLSTYTTSEQGRGALNLFSLSQFQSLFDTHLIMRAGEAAALTYGYSVANITSLSDSNIRLGAFTMLNSEVDSNNVLQFYIAVNPLTRIMYVVFRGTVGKQDELVDVNGVSVPLDIAALPLTTIPGTSPQVHDGFFSRFKNQKALYTKSIVEAYAAANTLVGETVSIFVVGHSLGAAEGFLHAANWAATGIPIAAYYAFGQPLVGNQDASNAIADQIGVGKYIRVTNKNDVIPHLGFNPNGAHAVNHNEVHVPFNAGSSDGGEFTICNGGQDPTCSINIPCADWSWEHHSECRNLSMRDEFIRMSIIVPASLYAI